MSNTIEHAKAPVHTYRDLNVFQQSLEWAMRIYKISSVFPADERFGLTDQIRRSSRSIPANIAEGWAKRKYPNMFKRHLYDAIGSCEEVKVWLEFARRCGYGEKERYPELNQAYAAIGAMLTSLVQKWK